MISVVLAGQAASENAEVTAEELIAQADERYAATDSECQSAGREIVVCAQQNENDRYRLPFETVTPGDPDDEGVWGERERLQAAPGTCQNNSYFQVDCGSVGIGVGIGFGGNSRTLLGGRRRAGQ